MSKQINPLSVNNINNANVKTSIGKSEKKLSPLIRIENQIYDKLNNKYGNKGSFKYQYLGLIMENFMFNKSTHLVSVFKDYMIVDYVEEFLKRYYQTTESYNRLPKFSLYYKNYLKFFCIPTLINLYSNNLIHNRFEKKAEFFYKENYKNKKSNNNNSSEQDLGLCEDSSETSEHGEENEENKKSKSKFDKTFFNEEIVKKIEKYSPIHSSMLLPSSGSKLKKDDSGLLVSISNEGSLENIVVGLDEKETSIPKKKKAQTMGTKKCKKKIKNSSFLLAENCNKNSNSLNKKTDNNKRNSDKKVKSKIEINNLENSKSQITKIERNIIPKKIESQKLKLLLNNNIKLLKSKSNKKFKKNTGLWELLKEKEIPSIKSKALNIKKSIGKINNNGQEQVDKSKNENLSYINFYKRKSIPKSKNKISLEEMNKNLLRNKKQNYSNISHKNINNLTNTSKFGSFENKNSYNNISSNMRSSKHNINCNNKNQLDTLLNKIKNNAFNSIKKRSLHNKKIKLKNQNMNYMNLTRNSHFLNKASLGFISNYTNSNMTKEKGVTLNNYKSNDYYESRTNSQKIKKNKFFNSPSFINDCIKMKKINNKIKKINANNKSNKSNKSNSPINDKSKQIHNVNININNQINIKFNHLNELIFLSGKNKKTKIHKKIHSRNKNRSSDFNTVNQNGVNNNNNPTFFSNYNKKNINVAMFRTNKYNGVNHKNFISRNNNILNYNKESFFKTNNKDVKIKNQYLFHSFKSFNH